ncbi:MAG: P1 family peptidase [Caulobacterales bacterium]
MIRPGARNAITDVPGIKVGAASDLAARTGVTVIVPDERAVAAVDVRGGGPGTRETDLLQPDALVDAVDAIVLSGGSVYGLAAADGVVAALAEQGRGFRPSPSALIPSPIVPAAILYDLANEGDKGWGRTPPYRRLGEQAFDALSLDVELGNAGAGFGAKAGGFKGGQGSASIVSSEGVTVGALACVNSFGSVLMPNSRAFWAWPFEIDGEFGGVRPWDDGGFKPFSAEDWGAAKANPAVLQNTTIATIATDAALTQAEAKRIAIMAQDGLARAIRPVHAPYDGDVVFVLSTGAKALAEPRAFAISHLGSLAADCLARAIARGVYHAQSLGAAPAYADKSKD